MSLGPQLLCPAPSSPAPPPPPLPFAVPIVDTFTASNGTDPTSRDIDSYAGIDALKRWAANYQPGQIQSNMLVGGGAWVADSIQVVNIELNTGAIRYPLPATWFLLIDGLTLAAGAYANDTVAPSFYLNLDGINGRIQWNSYRSSSGGSGIRSFWDLTDGFGTHYYSYDNPAWDPYYTIAGLGPHKFGVFIGQTKASLILNGAVIAESPDGVGVFYDFNRLVIEVDGSLTADTTLNRIAIYGPDDVADLAAAVALTT